VSQEATATVLSLFLIFCRIGACLMLLPGYSSNVVPANIRLFVAIAISLALSPGLLPDITPIVRAAGDDVRLQMIVTELLNGAMIGTLGRIFMIALQFAGNVTANSIGMGQAVGAAIEETEVTPAIVTLITMTATVMIFALNLHAEILKAILASYRTMPVEAGFAARSGLVQITDNLDETFLLCLRISSPFIVYAVIVNFAIGLMNKMTPQIPVYFISMPFVIAGGMMLLGVSVGDFLRIFIQNYQNWVFAG
jgi:flagellar biosynthetic protein FliR